MSVRLFESIGSDSLAASVWVPVLDPASPNAAGIYRLFVAVSVICLIIFLVVVTLICISLIRFRETGDALPKQNFGSHRSEIVWAILPVLIVLTLGILSAKLILSVTAVASPVVAQGDDPDLIVVGHQWWWEARYPAARVVAANEIHVPVGRKFLVEIDSADVIHSFWVPQLAPKMDMVPGRHNFLWLEADEAGTYDGACSEYCGDQHAWMRFNVVAETAGQYDTWINEQRLVASEPDGALARAGRDFFFSQTCINCHAIGGTRAIADAAPDLTHLATRRLLAGGVLPNTPQNLARWLRNPQDVKPGCLMPDFNLDDHQVQQLVSYLEGLQ